MKTILLTTLFIMAIHANPPYKQVGEMKITDPSFLQLFPSDHGGCDALWVTTFSGNPFVSGKVFYALDIANQVFVFCFFFVFFCFFVFFFVFFCFFCFFYYYYYYYDLFVCLFVHLFFVFFFRLLRTPTTSNLDKWMELSNGPTLFLMFPTVLLSVLRTLLLLSLMVSLSQVNSYPFLLSPFLLFSFFLLPLNIKKKKKKKKKKIKAKELEGSTRSPKDLTVSTLKISP